MGAHRFTWLERNVIVAATDMPGYDDRKSLQTEHVSVHYSAAVHVKTGIYGLQNLYTNLKSANERIDLIIDET